HRRHRPGPGHRPSRRRQPRRRRARRVHRGRRVGLHPRAAAPALRTPRAPRWLRRRRRAMSAPGAPGGPTNPTVLVVDDEEAFIEALAVGLGREGFDVEVARDGADALERFDEVAPDLVLLDVMLPTISGVDVCRALRRRSDVPIIMVTARASEIDTVVGLEVGADDYVTKPYRLRELVARMRAVLRRHPRRDGHGAPAEPGGGPGPVDSFEDVLVVGD